MDNNDSNGFPGEYDPDANVYRIQYEKHNIEPVSTVVAKAVAALTNTPPDELDPLYNAIDSDALNHLFSFDTDSSQRQADCRVTFTYNKCQVTVLWTGLIEIEPPADSESYAGMG